MSACADPNAKFRRALLSSCSASSSSFACTHCGSPARKKLGTHPAPWKKSILPCTYIHYDVRRADVQSICIVYLAAPYDSTACNVKAMKTKTSYNSDGCCCHHRVTFTWSVFWMSFSFSSSTASLSCSKAFFFPMPSRTTSTSAS